MTVCVCNGDPFAVLARALLRSGGSGVGWDFDPRTARPYVVAGLPAVQLRYGDNRWYRNAYVRLGRTL